MARLQLVDGVTPFVDEGNRILRVQVVSVLPSR